MGSDGGQDRFVRNVLQDCREGFWLEFGCGHPVVGNNTYVLENELGWRGVSIDIQPSLTRHWIGCRNMGNVLIGDALMVDWEKTLEYFQAPKIIDYLSMDLEPPHITFQAIRRIPFDKYKFKVITYEHDFYRGVMHLPERKGVSTPEGRREGAREFFHNLGYHRVSTACLDTYYRNLSASEDWYTCEHYEGVEYDT